VYGEPSHLRADVNVPLFTRLKWCIECTQRDCHPVFSAFLPEKLRSTLAAERACSCWGGPVFPEQVCAGEQPQVTLRDTAMCCKSCSVCLAAHGAVAVCGGSQFRVQLIPNASAEATAAMQRFGHLPLAALTLMNRTGKRRAWHLTRQSISQPPHSLDTLILRLINLWRQQSGRSWTAAMKSAEDSFKVAGSPTGSRPTAVRSDVRIIVGKRTSASK
jgi:hypothetical protein